MSLFTGEEVHLISTGIASAGVSTTASTSAPVARRGGDLFAAAAECGYAQADMGILQYLPEVLDRIHRDAYGAGEF